MSLLRGHTSMTSTQLLGFWTPRLHLDQILSTKFKQPPLLCLHLGNPLPLPEHVIVWAILAQKMHVRSSLPSK